MTAKFFTCKQSAGSGQCGAQFHEDDKEEYIEHLAAHGVDTSALARMPWWDEEGGFSISPTDRVPQGTPVSPSQFGDGSAAQIRENGKKWHELKALEAVSRHDVAASAFEGAPLAKTIEKKRREDREREIQSKITLRAPADVKGDEPPAAAIAAALTQPSPSAVVGIAADAVDQTVSKRARAQKETKKMAARTAKKPANPYAKAPVVSLGTSTEPEAGAVRVCVTTGRSYKDVAAIKSILELTQKAHPDAVIVNQDYWEGDKMVNTIAQSLGLNTETFLPKFLEARARQAPVIADGERMTVEQNAEFGFVELQNRFAEKCIELHVFGTPSGPQRGLIEAFTEAEKEVYRWGTAE